MNWIFSVFGLLTLLVYVAYCRGERSYLNALTGLTMFKCLVEFGLEPISYNLDLFDYDPESFLHLYLASFIGYAALVWGARRSPRRAALQPTRVRQVPTALPWLFLLAAFLLYLPIFVEFRQYLLDPRYIYENTRTGYGLQYFGSALLSNCALILFLLSARRQHLLFIALLLLFMLSKGSKGQVLTGILIYVVWLVYVLQRHFDWKRTLAGAAVVAAAMGGLFVLNFRGEIDSLVLTVASYSDYNRNASLILEEKPLHTYNGQLTFENIVISKIPRALWPGKPKNFGEFLLSEEYFPRLFDMDQGAPSFGIGVYFADFGYFAYLVILAVNLFTGRMLRLFVSRCERTRSVFSFVMLLFFCDVTLLPVGVGYYLLETLALAGALQGLTNLLSSRTMVINARRADAHVR